jgi:hypothetical protein
MQNAALGMQSAIPVMQGLMTHFNEENAEKAQKPMLKKGGKIQARDGGGLVGNMMPNSQAYFTEYLKKFMNQPKDNIPWNAMYQGFGNLVANPTDPGAYTQGALKGAEEDKAAMANRHEKYLKAAQIHQIIEKSRAEQADRENKFKHQQDKLDLTKLHLSEQARHNKSMESLSAVRSLPKKSEIRIGPDGTPYKIVIDPETGDESVGHIPGVTTKNDMNMINDIRKGASKSPSFTGFFTGKNSEIEENQEMYELINQGYSPREAYEVVKRGADPKALREGRKIGAREFSKKEIDELLATNPKSSGLSHDFDEFLSRRLG